MTRIVPHWPDDDGLPARFARAVEAVIGLLVDRAQSADAGTAVGWAD
jgi:hypothetical protein